jgi:histidinol dehydrogenase
VLPTGRSARFASGLSVFDFLKRTTYVAAEEHGLATIGPAAVALAEAEGLDAHALSISRRLDLLARGAHGPRPDDRET